MSYIIKTYNGTQISIVNDGTVDTTTDLTLVGRNYSGYGIQQNENFLYLLENFANNTPPPKPISGQIWFDKEANKLKFYDANLNWRTTGVDISSTRPSYLSPGDLWFDSINNLLYVYSLTGSTNNTPGYVLIGPPESKTSGNTSKFGLVTVQDVDGEYHDIFEAILDGTTTFTVSKDAEFELSSVTPISGFSIIKPGITIVDDKKSKLWGTTYTSDNMSIMINDVINHYSASIAKTPNTIAVRDADGYIDNGISIKSNSLKVGTNYYTASSSMPTITDKTSIVSRDSVGDFAANIVTATATQARYADLAEKYLADTNYEVGTVVMVGGEKEVTACKLGCRAIGVISENPAFMMNKDLVGGTYVALKGRVPVKVVGIVNKGDRLTSGDNGVARVPTVEFSDVFAIALETNTEDGIKLVEAVVL